jgi:hypothetical protein
LRTPSKEGLAKSKKLLLEWVTLERPRCWKRNRTMSPQNKTRKRRM